MSDLASAIGLAVADSELLRELKAGSEAAFAQLIAQYSHSIYSVVARSLRDPADAADVTQEVFVKVFRHISSFNGDSSLRTWIYRIALHEASNQRRWWGRHKRQEVTLDAEAQNAEGETYCLADMLPAGGASPYDNCCSAEARAQLTLALQTLPQDFRDVVVLREIEGFGYEEIAEMLNVNLGTVKSRLARGRAALREAVITQARISAAQRKTSPAPQSGAQLLQSGAEARQRGAQ
jgi:RNA polymerase sigma-70 factor (ECF subfamily)